MYLLIHAKPGAKRPGFCGMHDGCIKIAVKEAPQDGRVNDALRRLVADEFGLARCDVEVTVGEASRRKRLFLTGEPAALRQTIIGRLSHA